MNIEGALLRRIRLPERRADEGLLAASIGSLVRDYSLAGKIGLEPETLDIVQELYGRVVSSFGRLGVLEGKRILDLGCGSRTSKAPPGVTRREPASADAYTSLFEPWLCRILLSLGAKPVGVDLGDLSGESFEHYGADLGLAGALDFLPERSFDAVHDSRLFGSPEFKARFPGRADALRIAREIVAQETRVLREGGIVMHSDAHELAS